jgi:hypothetical protein
MASPRLVILLLSVLFLACGKKDDATPTPNLSAPVKETSYLAPAAEVSASNGPVKLTLRVLKKTFKINEGFWYQIELTNLSDKPMPVNSILFKMQPASYFYEDLIGLEFMGADGERAASGRMGVMESSHNTAFPPPPDRNAANFELAPRASTTTTPWALPERDGRKRKPMAQYTEFWESDYTAKRPLKVRAAYRYKWSPEIAKEMKSYGMTPSIWDVDVVTPWIILEEER